MTSKERILAAINGRPADHVPLTTWCFGFPAPEHLQWETNGRKVSYWYSQRLEHIHTLPQPWELEDEFGGPRPGFRWASTTCWRSPCRGARIRRWSPGTA